MPPFNDPQTPPRIEPMAEPSTGKGKLVARIGGTAAVALIALGLFWFIFGG